MRQSVALPLLAAGLLMAAAVMVTIPCLVLFFCTQRYFVKGVVTSGIKG